MRTNPATLKIYKEKAKEGKTENGFSKRLHFFLFFILALFFS